MRRLRFSAWGTRSLSTRSPQQRAGESTRKTHISWKKRAASPAGMTHLGAMRENATRSRHTRTASALYDLGLNIYFS